MRKSNPLPCQYVINRAYHWREAQFPDGVIPDWLAAMRFGWALVRARPYVSGL